MYPAMLVRTPRRAVNFTEDERQSMEEAKSMMKEIKEDIVELESYEQF